tara:strand:- start:285 stop:611 length:327 start_codon:yes stop_codon:yes gene_type:complete
MSEFYTEPACCEDITQREKQREKQKVEEVEPESDQEIKNKEFSFKKVKTLYHNYKNHLMCYLEFSAILAKHSYFMFVHAFYSGAYSTKSNELILDITNKVKENGYHKD